MSEKDIEAQLNKNDQSRIKESLRIHKNIENYTFEKYLKNGSSKYAIFENGTIKVESELEAVSKLKKKKLFQGEIVLDKLREINDKDVYEHRLKKMQREFQQELKNYIHKSEVKDNDEKIREL